MRILIVSGIYPPDIGGPATHAAQLAVELSKRGHEIQVLSLSDGDVREPSIIRFPRRWPWILRFAAVVSWIVRHRRSFDVVYATGLLFPAVAGGRLAHRPTVVKVVADPAWEAAVRRGLTPEAFDAFQTGPGPGFKLRVLRALRDYSVRHAERVTAPSPQLADAVRGWVPDRRVELIQNGVRSPAETHDRSRETGRLRAVFAGRLVPVKRVDVLIDAVGSAAGVTLDIFGSGPERSNLEVRAKEFAPHRIRFHGPVSHAALIDALLKADAVLLASEHEGLPHVVLEAVACGTPAVVAPLAGLAGVIREGETGLIVDPPTPAGFAHALAHLRDDPALNRRMATACRESAAAWSIERNADQVEALLSEIVDPAPKVVFVGKTVVPDPPGHELERKFDILSRHLDTTIVAIGPRHRSNRGLVHVVTLPQLRPRILGGVLFYAIAPVIALAHARGRRSAIVCQSPYEAVATMVLRHAIPRAARPVLVVEVHGDWRTAGRLYGSRARKLLTPVGDRLAARAVRSADRVRVIGAYTEHLAREAGFRGELDRFVAFNDFSSFLLDKPVPPPSGHVAFVGVLERYKGVDVLLDAWKIVLRDQPSATLTLAGKGPLGRQLLRTAQRLGIDGSIRFLGRIPRSEIKTLLDGSTCLVLPSRSEGLGLVVLEALARGRPVIASRVGGIPELVEHRVNGLLVAPDAPADLAAGILEILGDPLTARAMGINGRKRAVALDPAEQFESGIARLRCAIGNR